MSVPHKLSRTNASSILVKRIIRQQEQARDAEKRLDEVLE